MQTYIAHYVSPTGSSERTKGIFEFESDARMGTKANAHDARLKMLELFGAPAVSWNIEKIERKRAKAADNPADGQLALDFRPPKPERKRKHSKGYW
jgi:hypothetical protein